MANRPSNPPPARAYGGAPVFAGIRITAGATTLAGCAEAWGVRSITRNGAGDYSVTLNRHKGCIAQVTLNATDTTLFHQTRTILQTDSTQTFRFVHRSVAFASVASGDALSDSFVSLDVLFYQRGE